MPKRLIGRCWQTTHLLHCFFVVNLTFLFFFFSLSKTFVEEPMPKRLVGRCWQPTTFFIVSYTVPTHFPHFHSVTFNTYTLSQFHTLTFTFKCSPSHFHLAMLQLGKKVTKQSCPSDVLMCTNIIIWKDIHKGAMVAVTGECWMLSTHSDARCSNCIGLPKQTNILRHVDRKVEGRVGANKV